jgi:hypothetical protein
MGGIGGGGGDEDGAPVLIENFPSDGIDTYQTYNLSANPYTLNPEFLKPEI